MTGGGASLLALASLALAPVVLAPLALAPRARAEALSLRAPGLRLALVDEPSYRRGLQLDLRGDHGAAAQAYQASHRAHPAPRALFHAKLSDGMARTAQALTRAPDSYDEHFNLAVNAQNKYWALFLDLGVKEHRLRRLAEHHFRRALLLEPNAANPAYCLAALYAQAGERLEAEAMYRVAAARPLRPGDHYNRAFFHKVMGDLDEAYRVLRIAVSFDARHRDWLLESDDFAELRDEPRFRELLNLAARGGALGLPVTGGPFGGLHRLRRPPRLVPAPQGTAPSPPAPVPVPPPPPHPAP